MKFPIWRPSTPSLVWPALAVIVFCSLAAFLIENAALNTDEGFYANACRLAFRGELPYRDFGYTQTPAFPYLQGLALYWASFTVGAERWINALWTGIALVLVYRRLRSGGLSTLGSSGMVLLFVTSVPLLYYCTIGKTYALAQLLLVLAGIGLWRENPRHALLQTAFFGTLAVGCRLPVAPTVAVLYLAVLVRGWREKAGFTYLVLPPLIFGAAVFLPFLLSAPENFYFWNWEIHHLRDVPRRAALDVVWLVMLLVPSLLVVGLVAPIARGWRGILAPERRSFTFCLVAAWTGILVNTVAGSMYAEYVVPFFALLLIGAGGLISERRIRPSVQAGCLVLGCLLNLGALSLETEKSYIERGFGSDLRAAGKFLRGNTSEGALVIGSLLDVTLEAGRESHPRLAMGLFTVTGDCSPATAERLRMMHLVELVYLVQRGDAEGVVLCTGGNVNFEYSVPSMKPFKDAGTKLLHAAIWEGKYRLAYRNSTYIVLLRKNSTGL